MLEIVMLGIVIIILFFLVKFLSLSMKLVWNAIIGSIGLYLYNLLAITIGLKTIGFSIINVLLVGFFGIPGLVALIIWQFISKGNI